MADFNLPLGATWDDETPKGSVRLTVVIPNLKKKKGLFPKAHEIENGEIGFKWDPKLVKLQIKMTKPKDDIGAQWELPEAVEGGDFKAEKGKVLITLKKAEDKPWACHLSTDSIEMEDLTDPILKAARK